MSCADVARFIHVYVDGEFEAEERLELERHLDACASCADVARGERAFVSRLRESLREDRPPVPPTLRPRIAHALAEVDRPRATRIRTFALVGIPSLAAAAALLLAWRGERRVEQPLLLSEAVARHERELPVEVKGPDPEMIRTWFRGKLDMPVRPPTRPGSRAQLVGARLSHLGQRQAAYLVYDLGGTKFSVLVFDPDDPAASDLATDRLRHRTVGGKDVYVGGAHGYNVAVVRAGGLGYAFTSDLPEQRMLDLLSTSFSF